MGRCPHDAGEDARRTEVFATKNMPSRPQHRRTGEGHVSGQEHEWRSTARTGSFAPSAPSITDDALVEGGT